MREGGVIVDRLYRGRPAVLVLPETEPLATPYSVNTHRLLVRGKRTDYKEAIKKTPNEVNNGIHIPYEVKLALLSFIIIGIIIFIWRRR